MTRASPFTPTFADLFPAIAGLAASPSLAADERPAAWAKPAAPGPGLVNVWHVDNRLIRGAQPSEQGLRTLRAMGVRTIINLRQFHQDDPLPHDAGFAYWRVPTHAATFAAVDIAAFLRVAADPDAHPVFVHCRQGSDRTGAMVAAYRIVVQGWSHEEAIEEMTRGGFGYHAMWGNLVHRVRELDVAAIRHEAGLPHPTTIAFV